MDSQDKNPTLQHSAATATILPRMERLEEIVLCLLLSAMIVLACLQILLRSGFSGGLLFIDPLLRYLVLWCGLLGAVTATGRNKHIALDISSKYLPKTLKPWVRIATTLFCVFASAGLTWSAWRFLMGEVEFGGSGLLQLPQWFWGAIFPLCFGLITLKYVVLFGRQLRMLLRQHRGNRATVCAKRGGRS